MPINQITLKKLIEKSQLVSKSNLESAQITSRHLGCSITNVLVGRSFIKEEDLGKILAKYFRVKFVNLNKTYIPVKCFKHFTGIICNQKGCCPLF